MFGCLFDEQVDSSANANVMTTVHHVNTSVLHPPKPRPSCGFSGILNQGATCYLNSLLQTLLFTPEFREGLFKLTESELGISKEKGGKVRIIPLQLQRLFARLLLLDQNAASTTDLTDSFGWGDSEGLQEHDVQELNRILFSAIERSLIGTSGSDLISKLYHGSTCSEIICQTCGKISEREEDFLDLNVIVANFSSLQESLYASYIQVEIMKEKNQYRCSTCCKLVDAKKGLKIRCLPPILTFCLSRFSYDIAKGERIKETGKFTFPLELDMSPYCEKEVKSDDSVYELFSVVIHSGSSYAGHYHAYIRDIDHLGKWFAPDKEPLVLPTPGTNSLSTVQGPVALIKHLLLQQSDHCSTVEALCQDILKSTGLSWGKRFKNSYGPINKFLQKHSDVFFFNPSTNFVYLKETSGPMENSINDSMSVDNSPANSCDSAPGSPKESKKLHSKSPLKLSFFEKKKSSPLDSFQDQDWFDFNDSKVSPILTRDIETQYSGKESAYILFYRRKSLIRPEEARGNAKYMMPQWLLDMVQQENEDLRQQRELHETALNTVTFQVHFTVNYEYKHGALQLKEDRAVPVACSMDRRKALKDAKELIYQFWFEAVLPDNGESSVIMYIARSLPSGFHLYQELSPSLNDMSLTELGILEGTHIFVSHEGREIGGIPVSVGPECEPILLHISAILSNGETSKFSTGVPKSTSFIDLKSFICAHICLEEEDIVIKKLEEQGNETRKLQLNEDKVNWNLSELSLKDNDNLIVESISYSESQKMLDKTLCVVIQDRCTVFSENGIANFPIFELDVSFEQTILDLKNTAITKFKLDNAKQYRLRKYLHDHRRGPPLHENQTVMETGLLDAIYLVLEEGFAPLDEEITLLFSVGECLDDDCCFEINISKKQTVQQCLKVMLASACLTGDNWKLQKTNCCGEIETLFIENTTLEEEGIQHGDFLLLAINHVPPKGYMSFKIWMFPTLENLCCSNQPHVNGIISDYNTLYHSLTSMAKSECGLIELGQIEISGDSTVADLKKYILTLPVFTHVRLPNLHYLRVRQLDGNRPGKVIRGLSVTLKKLRLHSQRSLCVQLLAHEEDLTQESIVLNICLRDPNERTYSPPTEMTWNTSESASLKVLKAELSNSFNIPVHRLVVAKHFYDKYEWQVIEDNSNQKKTNRRWNTKKTNLRYAPYYLKDGDTLGIKDQLTDPENLDDFTTAEDIEGQEILRKRAQQKMETNDDDNKMYDGKRFRRRTRRNFGFYDEWSFDRCGDFDLSSTTKNHEKGITIHVDDFG